MWLQGNAHQNITPLKLLTSANVIHLNEKIISFQKFGR